MLPADTAIIEAGNRGLRYGDGLFETIKYKNNSFQLLDKHLDRLWSGFELMKFDLPTLFTRTFVAHQLLQLLQKNKHTHARVRLTVVRGNGGLYDAVNLQPNFIIESWQLPEDFGKFNSNGLQLCIYGEAKKSCDDFSNLKHNNFLPYTMGALFAKENKYNDAIVLNQFGRICDSTIANIFIIKNGGLYTPALTEACIAGTMRQFLMEYLPAIGFKIMEIELSVEQLLDADEIFLTNSITALKWVAAVEDRTFHNKQTLAIYHEMHQTFPDIFC